MKENKFSINSRIKSFVFAFNGLKVLFREEHNARIHILMAVLAIAAGFFLHISTGEWLAVVVCIGLVLMLELVNSAIENVCDLISPQKNAFVEKAKDLAAAGVLIAALTAAVVGLIIFCPKLYVLIVGY